MANPRAGGSAGTPAGGVWRWLGLAAAFLFMLTAVAVSTGLVVYTAWRHDLKDGLFALAFAVLSTRAALSWCLWRDGNRQTLNDHQQDREGSKPADGPTG